MNRRLLLQTAAAAILGSSFGSAAGKPKMLLVGGGVVVPLVGPAASWNGTVLSGIGGVEPTNPTRTTAKPIAHFAQNGENVLTGNTTYTVMATANGNFGSGLRGIASVEFFGDCASTTPSFSITNGIAGWSITLNNAAFLAVSGSGTGRLFARVTPNDPSMQVQIIGYARTETGSVVQNDWQMTFYPRATFAFDKTIGAGGDYATLFDFITAARAATATTTRGTFITDGGFYEATNIAGDTGTASAVGLMKLRVQSSGVSVTVGRATPFDPDGSNTNTSWLYRPGWHGIDFGSGISLDTRNWTALVSNKACVLAGLMTNSIASAASVYQTYWNKGIKPEFRVYDTNGNVIRGWALGSTIEYQSNVTGYLYSAVGVKARYMSGAPFDNTDFVANTYLTQSDATTANNISLFTITYAGAGTTATFDRTGFAITLKVDGSTVGAYTCVSHPGAADSTHVYAVDDLATKVNALSGWTMTVISSTLRCEYLGGESEVHNLNVFHTTPTVTGSLGIHTEVYHSFTGGATRYNVHLLNVAVSASNMTTAAWNFENALSDCGVENCSYAGSGGQAQVSNWFGYAVAASHCFVWGVQNDGASSTYRTTCDSYCSVENSILRGFYNANGAAASYPAMKNNLISPGSQGNGVMPSGPNDSGNVSITDAQYLATWTGYAVGNPVPAGVAISNLFARAGVYDQAGQARASSDAAGARKIGGSTPAFTSWPVPDYPWT